MTQITLPISEQDYTPDLPEEPRQLESRQLKARPELLNSIERVVEWIHSSKDYGWFHHSLILTIATIISAILVCTVVLSPLFVYGFRGFIVQRERARFDDKFEDLLEMAKEGNRMHFLRGRLDPICKLNISLPHSTRDQMVRDLQASEQANTMSDQELLLAAALKFDNYLNRYGLEIQTKPPASSERCTWY